jgi:hypothetical protein
VADLLRAANAGKSPTAPFPRQTPDRDLPQILCRGHQSLGRYPPAPWHHPQPGGVTHLGHRAISDYSRVRHGWSLGGEKLEKELENCGVESKLFLTHPEKSDEAFLYPALPIPTTATT